MFLDILHISNSCIPLKKIKEPIIYEELGLIYGRDAMYLDKIEFDRTRNVKLIGEFNSSLCEKTKSHEDKYIPYELTFNGILEFKVIELDFYYCENHVSSFEQVINSDRINEFSKNSQGFKVKDSHKHYIIHTYDDVIELIASGFELKIYKNGI